ncbi:molybdopterin molybdenumtransferase MoeA [Pedobacter sp. HMF7647]|uniref:Molybdopterin molybdenumtransferase n=1 Tax=Hufsiella arboris TaxID=2695275 RepID=A0A7K1Y594_9SPHI|nr:molybdopterin molybdotransferase MoeA [Hufsiella arboris]MXV49755.1 molybdopterin molybdenumtransferase MoeA [Hufsiella arboris]
MITYQEALQIILSHARSFGDETVLLENADGRVLAEDIFADRDYPPFNRSTVDGYAINIEEWRAGLKNYRIAETIFAGNVSEVALASGQCYKIMTGASVPKSASAVIRREDVFEDSGSVTINVENIEEQQNISKQGEDAKKGDLILGQGLICQPNVISILASLGKGKVKVKRLPDVVLFTTGNEVKSIDSIPGPVEIRNSNKWLLTSLLKKLGIDVQRSEHISDSREDLYSAIESGLDCDVMILCGGVSAGDADYVPETLEKLGVKKLFHKVAIKPGKPIWCGISPTGTMVFALPGNPFSCLITFKIFIEEYLRKCLGFSPRAVFTLPLTGGRTKKVPFDEFFPTKLAKDGKSLEQIAINSSGDIKLGLHANSIALHPADRKQVESGESVSYFSLFT